MRPATRRSLIVVLSFALMASISALVSTKDGIATGGSNGIVVVDTGDVGYYASMALGASDTPIIAHYDNANNHKVKLLNCGDTSCTSGNVSSSPADASAFISLDLDANGNPAVAYRALSTPFYHLGILRCNDPQCSSPTVTDTVYVGDRVSLELDASGYPVIAAQGLKIVHCNDPDCAGSDESETSPAVGIDPSLALDAAGNPIVAFHTVNDLGILHCTDANCSAATVNYPDTDSSAGAENQLSLALDSAGNPVVSYHEYPSYDLKVLHCGDPYCGANNTIATPDLGYASYTSIAVGQSDNPVVAYYNGNGAIKLLRCGNPACSSGNSIMRLDVGNVGAFPSLALDSSGDPIVAYQQDNGSFDHDLKVAYCGSPACDADNDGCADTMEEQSAAGIELYGGRRNPKNPNDYFNPTHDGVNRVDDILAVGDQYYMDDNDGNPGLPPYAAGYNPDTDRTLLGPDAWDTGPPNGLQRVDDILYQLKQYFHDCS